jgi:hypothetical protein
MTIKVVGSWSGLESARSSAEAENHERKEPRRWKIRQDKAVEGESTRQKGRVR